MSDALALDWLDRLLTQSEEERAASMAELARTEPQLHSRLSRLLAAALSPDHSLVLAQPVVDGIDRLDADSIRVLSAGDVLAGYRLIRELGRGGMAVVWLAERADGVVKREVALKMLMLMLHGAQDIARFERERDVLASLGHPNVARLYDAGVLPSGQPFIVLERIDGLPLTEYCDARKLDLNARLRVFLQVLAAVDHAHKHLVVHRDLKPSNIQVDMDGQVKLLDFGIAKLLSDGDIAGAQLTQQVGSVMTPLYAAPEQLRGGAISTSTDIFSAGVVLHELLTGTLPYRTTRQRPTVVEVLECIDRGELPRAGLRGDLDTIVGKALRIDPQERYDSAVHFSEDIRRFLDRKPITARRPSFWYTVQLALARHRLAAATAGAGLLAVMIASGVAWQQYMESRAHAERTAAVRDFMFDLVNDAEADENHAAGEVTGRQMLDGAVRRARRDFQAQPRLQGELLGELGRMYTRLDASEVAVPVLREALGLLEKHAPLHDPALNKARAHLASALLQTGEELAPIRTLALQARSGCNDPDIECAKARAYAESVVGQVESFAGETEASLAAMRRSVAETERGFGAAHAETAMALMSLAIIARNNGQVAEASAAMRRAVNLSESLHMRAADRIGIERTMAVLDYDLGHYDDARTRLIALIERTKSHAERALQLRLLANVYVELGDAGSALRSSDQALNLLPEEADRSRMALRVPGAGARTGPDEQGT